MSLGSGIGSDAAAYASVIEVISSDQSSIKKGHVLDFKIVPLDLRRRLPEDAGKKVEIILKVKINEDSSKEIINIYLSADTIIKK